MSQNPEQASGASVAQARALWQKGQHFAARRMLESLLAGTLAGHELAHARLGLAIICREIGDAVTAIDLLNLLNSEWHHYPEKQPLLEGAAAYNLGLCHRQRRELHLAVECYRKAESLFAAEGMNDFRRQALQNLAWVHAHMHQPDLAMDYLDQAEPLCTLDLARWQQRIGRAYCNLRFGDVPAVVELAQEIADSRNCPEEIRPHAYWLLGLCLFELDKIMEAKRTAEKGLCMPAVTKDARLYQDLIDLIRACSVNLGAG